MWRTAKKTLLVMPFACNFAASPPSESRLALWPAWTDRTWQRWESFQAYILRSFACFCWFSWSPDSTLNRLLELPEEGDVAASLHCHDQSAAADTANKPSWSPASGVGPVGPPSITYRLMRNACYFKATKFGGGLLQSKYYLIQVWNEFTLSTQRG